MSLHARDFSPVLLIGTFNLAQKTIEQDLGDWLATHPSLSSISPSSPSTSAPLAGKSPLIPDIVAVAFQEFVPYPDAFLPDTYNVQTIVDTIAKTILRTLHRTFSGHRFTLISQPSLAGMLLFVLTRDGSITEHVQKVWTAKVGTGPLCMSNKGAVATRLSIAMPDPEARPFDLCIINAHLSAHLKHIKKRNKDYKNICRRMVFVREDGENDDVGHDLPGSSGGFYQQDLASSATTSSVASSRSSWSHASFADNDQQPLLQGSTSTTSKKPSSSKKTRKARQETIFDCDYVFWAGDLNYRLDLHKSGEAPSKKTKRKDSKGLVASFGSADTEPLLSNAESPAMTAGEIVETIENGHYRTLYSHDQLSAQRQSLEAFKDFHEAPLGFAPTFKFFPGTSRYNAKKRVPAWTDRVLWYVHPKDHTTHEVQALEEIDAWDQHSVGLGGGSLPMEAGAQKARYLDLQQQQVPSSRQAAKAAGYTHGAELSGSTLTDQEPRVPHLERRTSSMGTFSSMSKRDGSGTSNRVRAGIDAKLFQAPQSPVPSTHSTIDSMRSSASSGLQVGHDVILVQECTSPLMVHYYTSHPGYQFSDHKPVSILFTLLPHRLSPHHEPSGYGIDPQWARKRKQGEVLTMILGHFLRWGYLVIGLGLVVGLITLVRRYLHRW